MEQCLEAAHSQLTPDTSMRINMFGHNLPCIDEIPLSIYIVAILSKLAIMTVN